VTGGGGGVSFKDTDFIEKPGRLTLQGLETMKPTVTVMMKKRPEGVKDTLVRDVVTQLVPGMYELACDRADYNTVIERREVKADSDWTIDLARLEWPPKPELAALQKAEAAWNNQPKEAAVNNEVALLPVAWVPSCDEHRKQKARLEAEVLEHFSNQVAKAAQELGKARLDERLWENQVAVPATTPVYRNKDTAAKPTYQGRVPNVPGFVREKLPQNLQDTLAGKEVVPILAEATIRRVEDAHFYQWFNINFPDESVTDLAIAVKEGYEPNKYDKTLVDYMIAVCKETTKNAKPNEVAGFRKRMDVVERDYQTVVEAYEKASRR
jgi:hypothetical protein